jgi:hypothetical protein
MPGAPEPFQTSPPRQKAEAFPGGPKNVNLAQDAVFQCVMVKPKTIPNILGVNISLKVAYIELP